VQLREEIRRIQLEVGITTIYVTHDQEEALSISDRVAVLSQGRIEQIGPPATIYGSPETPFVAEFVGTMNRLESTVADPDRGEVDYGGVRLAVEAARGRVAGERLLVLVRPESLELEQHDDGADGLAGEILTHTFLGPVTRLKIGVGEGELTADLPAARADALPIGMRVRAGFPAAAARVLSLEAEEAPPG
jgi:putative spermidine/putrescine transport system ATP-binding protein